jgi:hypothetical protein
MRTFNKAVVLTSLLLLAACGGEQAQAPAKLTKIDGTSNRTAELTYEKLRHEIKDTTANLQASADLAMLKLRFSEGDQLAKAIGGKTLEELKPLIAETHVFSLNRVRDGIVKDVMAPIPELQAKLDKWNVLLKNDPNSLIAPPQISKIEAQIKAQTQLKEQILALSDEEFAKQYSGSYSVQ